MITLVQTGTPIDSIWETLLTLSQRQANGWTLIGAHMVALHALEQGRTPPRRSEDIDVLVNVRAMQGGTRKLSQVLLELGFLLDPPNPEGVSHRFRNQRLSIDLLAPDGISERTSRTTVPPARTVMVPGGTQALQRTKPSKSSWATCAGPFLVQACSAQSS